MLLLARLQSPRSTRFNWLAVTIAILAVALLTPSPWARGENPPPGEVAPFAEDATELPPANKQSGEENEGDAVGIPPKETDAETEMRADDIAPRADTVNARSRRERLAQAVEPVDGDAAGMEPATVEGVGPLTSLEDLHSKWGQPKASDAAADALRETYALPTLGTVQVIIVDEAVDSLAVQLDKPQTIEAISRLLELGTFEPVEIFDNSGRPAGRSYPERGVLLGYVKAAHSQPQVEQIVVEPIDAQPFLDRAVVRMRSRYAECLGDLNHAFRLDPDNARARWLHAELALRAGELEAALQSAEKAVSLEPDRSEPRLILAKVMCETCDYDHAIEQLREVAERKQVPPLDMAKAYCLWGDCVAANRQRDFAQAMQLHTEAVKLAKPLAAKPDPATRYAAKRVLLDAHLAIAHDIAWGRWQNKSKVVPKWLEQAAAHADDFVARGQASHELHLEVNQRALAALAGIAEPPDPRRWIAGLETLAPKLVASSSDTTFKAHIAWRLGTALADAAEIEMALNHSPQALELGQRAMGYLEQGEAAAKQLPLHDYLRGRLCYRLGAVFAIDRSDHEQALAWYLQAVPLLENPVPACAMVDPARQGEIFVSMAVSYWQLNKRDDAVRLTEQGVQLMEQAASEQLIRRAALAIPYGNLASMHEQLGDKEKAKQFSELASRANQPAKK